VFHEEFGSVAALAAAKAFEGVPDWRDAERGRLFVVKGAEGSEVGTAAAQGEEFANNLLNAGGFKDEASGGGWYHARNILGAGVLPWRVLIAVSHQSSVKIMHITAKTL
jgi:hypothetical protein